MFRSFHPLLALLLLLSTLTLTPATVSAKVPYGLFGSIEFQGATEGTWNGFGPKVTEALDLFARCAREPSRCPRSDVRALMAEVAQLRGRDTFYKLFAVNRLGNRQPYRGDHVDTGDHDNWASPLEFLARSGDCEDYAIFKYALLLHMGLPIDALMVVLLRQIGNPGAHAVLAAHVGSETYILDNLSGRVLPHRDIANYQPVYSFNEERRWAHFSVSQEARARD